MKFDFNEFYDKNYRKLEDEFLEQIDYEEGFKKVEWDEFVWNKYEEFISEYEDMMYEQYKESRYE